jgi:hypothetical protein
MNLQGGGSELHKVLYRNFLSEASETEENFQQDI